MKDKATIHLIGNAHLDPVWLWSWQEGAEEVLQTFRSALDRLNEYPQFIFTCSAAQYYRWVKEMAPDMFEEIKERVAEGRWIPVGGWAVQPDCNLPAGESYARSALYSQLFYLRNFGRICRTGYNVDSFGHSAMLPQLLRLGGMDAYVMMRPDKNENKHMPEGAFIWKSMDGSEVVAYRISDCYCESGTQGIDRGLGILDEIADKTGHDQMLFYGVGNHGGGPTRGDLEYLIKKNESDENFAGRLQFSSPDEYFLALCAQRRDLPVWNDEMQHHSSGCYSATSLVKKFNRLSENTLINAEKWSTIATVCAGKPDGTADFEEAWRKVNFNQFHDIMCGCSIMEAYDDVRNSFGKAIDIGREQQNAALLMMSRRIDTWIDGVSDPVTNVRHYSGNRKFPRPVVVFNPLSFPIKVPVRVYNPSRAVCDSDGNDVIFQNVRSSRSNDTHMDTLFIADLPSMGYAVYHLYWLYDEGDEEQRHLSGGRDMSDMKAGSEPFFMENKYLKVVFNEKTGTISSFVDKTSGREYRGKKDLAVPTVIDDHKTDTWAHNVFVFHDIKGIMDCTGLELIENGPARAVIRGTYTFGKSTLFQDFILAYDQKVLRVKCKAIWSEQFTLLKMSFPIDGKDEISTYEIQNAWIKRPCDGWEEPAQNWGDLTVTAADGGRCGLSVISDSKYSYDCPKRDLRLTCIRNVIFADHYSNRPPALFNFTDEGIQRFEYAVYAHEGEAEDSAAVIEGLKFNNRPATVPESYHKGTEPLRRSFLRVGADNVVLQAMKFCEDGSNDIVVRLYETAGRETHTSVMCAEPYFGFYADFGPHEIKTFRIDPSGSVLETDFLEGITLNDNEETGF